MQQPLRSRRGAREIFTRPEAEVSPLRLRAFAAILLLLLGALIARLWYLQVLQGERFRATANANRWRLLRDPAPRGVVEDARGRVLATNRAQFTVYVVPTDLPKAKPERKEVLALVARLLGVTFDELADTIQHNRARASDPVPVAEGVDMHVLTRFAENRMRLPGVTAQPGPVRFYPNRSLAAHVLGSIGQISETELADRENAARGYRAGDLIGKNGIEREYDRFLQGQAGGTWYEVDAAGRRQQELRVEPATAGATLRLCLDQSVQTAAEKAMAGRHGAAVALDPRSGRVFALMSGPSYDPNLFARRPLLAKNYHRLVDPRQNRLLNRAVASAQPPGSTFKIVTATAGLATGAITPQTGDYCRGGIPLGGRIKRCHGHHGAVDLVRAIAVSCDVFFYHAGFRIHATPLADWAENFGLGRKTGIDLPSERAGTVPSPAWKQVMAPKYGNPDAGWYPGDTANMAIGQGDLQTTPLQMAQVAAAIGTGGTVYRPRIVERAVAADGETLYRMTPEVTHRLPVSPGTLAEVAQGMRAAVAGPGGTSHSAALPGIAVAGKSGSAETRGGGPTHAWFICYAPYQNPTIAVCVFLETQGEGLHGGADAAPIARAMMAAHFNIKAGG